MARCYSLDASPGMAKTSPLQRSVFAVDHASDGVRLPLLLSFRCIWCLASDLRIILLCRTTTGRWAHRPNYTFERNSRGPLPVTFRKARVKLAGDEYPSSADTRVIEPFVCRSSSAAR